MQLTKWTDYSLRVLMYCAVHEGRSAPVTVTEIQRVHGISRSHLTKVVMSLAALGYLATTRGRGGGLRLQVPAGSINVGSVVRQTETDFRLVECFDSASNTCVLDGHCRLKSVLQDAQARFMDALDSVTLADILTPGMKCAPAPPESVLPARPRRSGNAAAASKGRGRPTKRSAGH